MSLSHQRGRFGDPRALAARLNQRVTIQQPVYTDDAAGGGTVVWNDVATVWAEIRSRGGGAGERLFAGKLEASATHEITLRYRSDVTPAMRVSYDGRVFNIRRVEDVDAAGVLLELLAEEGVA